MITHADRFVTHQAWIGDAVGCNANLVRTADWGALTERRVELRSGLQVEFGFVEPSWAESEPIDPGTRRVVTDGCEPWYDPIGLLSHLLLAAGSAR